MNGGIAIKMVRKYDKYGLNRQFKNKPCSRRDPFPRDHLPFVDDMSVKKILDDAIKTVKPPIQPGKRPRDPATNNTLPNPKGPKRHKSWGKRHPYERDALVGLGVVGGIIGSLLAPEGLLAAGAVRAGAAVGAVAEEVEMTPLLRGRAVTGVKKTYGSIRKATRLFKKFRRSEKVAWRAARQIYKML